MVEWWDLRWEDRDSASWACRSTAAVSGRVMKALRLLRAAWLARHRCASRRRDIGIHEKLVVQEWLTTSA